MFHEAFSSMKKKLKNKPSLLHVRKTTMTVPTGNGTLASSCSRYHTCVCVCTHVCFLSIETPKAARLYDRRRFPARGLRVYCNSHSLLSFSFSVFVSHPCHVFSYRPAHASTRLPLRLHISIKETQLFPKDSQGSFCTKKKIVSMKRKLFLPTKCGT